MARTIGGVIAFLTLCGMLAGPPAHADGTPVERGDVLFVSVIGVPEIVREARVDIDGRITLPLVGAIDVAGSDLEAITQRIAQVLIDEAILIKPSVLVEVAAYRPIWVGGAVRNSGSVAYEPGLTVRHALIAAGGRSARDDDAPALGQVLELMARQRAAERALEQVDSEIARYAAWLDAEEGPDRDALDPVDAALLEERRSQREADLEHAETAMELVDTELEVLRGQAELQQTEQELQREEVERTRTLVERGLVPGPKLAELRREVSRLSRDILDNHAYSARAEQSRVDIAHSTQAKLTERRIATREAHRDALVRREQLRTELDILEGHLLAAGQETERAETGEATGGAVIYRPSGGTTMEMDATPDTVLEPGDIVEFSLPRLPRG